MSSTRLATQEYGLLVRTSKKLNVNNQGANSIPEVSITQGIMLFIVGEHLKTTVARTWSTSATMSSFFSWWP